MGTRLPASGSLAEGGVRHPVTRLGERGVAVELIEKMADAFVASDDDIVLATGQPASAHDEILRRHDGRTVRALPEERRYTTRTLLLTEERLVRRAVQGRGLDAGLAHPVAIERAIAARPTL
jgi:hypothetical protein